MNKISAVYKIINIVTKDCYVGSSNNIKKRWTNHKCFCTWKKHPNSPMYQDLQKYGVDKFMFQILAPVEPKHLKQVEQEFIEMLNPTYNNHMAKGLDVKRYKKNHKKYLQSDKGKEVQKKSRNKYNNQLCLYNGKTVTLSSLASRFHKAGIKHATLEAKKYLLTQQ